MEVDSDPRKQESVVLAKNNEKKSLKYKKYNVFAFIVLI